MMRRGATILECTLALAITAAATALFAQVLVANSNQRRVAEQRRLALAEVANRLERASLLSWDELTPEQLEKSPLSPAALAALPGATLTAEVREEEGAVRSRRVRIELSWTNAAGQRQAPVTLAGWHFAAKEVP